MHQTLDFEYDHLQHETIFYAEKDNVFFQYKLYIFWVLFFLPALLISVVSLLKALSAPHSWANEGSYFLLLQGVREKLKECQPEI